MLKKIRLKIVHIILISFILLFSLILICLTIGPTNISFLTVLITLMKKIPFLKQYISIYEYPIYIDTILFYVRLPRIITSLFVGASLSIIGATYQGILKKNYNFYSTQIRLYESDIYQCIYHLVAFL